MVCFIPEQLREHIILGLHVFECLESLCKSATLIVKFSAGIHQGASCSSVSSRCYYFEAENSSSGFCTRTLDTVTSMTALLVATAI